MTERQEQLLDILVREYVRTASPVSSQAIERKARLGVSSATIRNELHQLTKEGYLNQPHTAAGRIPTDKGYRFIVNKLIGTEGKKEAHDFGISPETEDTISFLQKVTRQLAEDSSSLVLSYIAAPELIWKEGWEDILRAPEFQDTGFSLRFIRFLEDIEMHIGELSSVTTVQIYIGGENSFSRVSDFSLMFADMRLDNYEGKIAMIGPKRMSYNKNITLMQSLVEFLDQQ